MKPLSQTSWLVWFSLAWLPFLLGFTTELNIGYQGYKLFKETIERLDAIPANMVMLAGFLLLFLGYKLYYWIIPAPLMYLMAVLGWQIASEEALWIRAVVVLILILVTAFTVWLFYTVSLLILAGVFTGLLLYEMAGLLFGKAEVFVVIIIPLAFLGAFFAGWVHDRLVGLLGALLGSWLLSGYVGYDGIMLYVVALFGFAVQYGVAKVRGEDVFRRRKLPVPPQEEKPKHEIAPDAFDPNAEIQVYED